MKHMTSPWPQRLVQILARHSCIHSQFRRTLALAAHSQARAKPHSKRPDTNNEAQLPRSVQPLLRTGTVTSAVSFPHVSPADDDMDDTSPGSLERTLTGIEALSVSVQSQLSSLTDTAPSALIKSLSKKRATVKNSLAILMTSAFDSHRSFARGPMTLVSGMSQQLIVLEKIFNAIIVHGHPTNKQFSQMIEAYGREAQRTKIHDLYDRWAQSKEAYDDSRLSETDRLRKAEEEKLAEFALTQELESSSNDGDSGAIVPASLRAIMKERKDLWRLQRLARERHAPSALPQRPLYPVVKLDTTGYNSLLSSFLSSLTLSSLKPDSPVLAFPLSLLPTFEHDTVTYSILMNLYSAMKDTGRVMKLLVEWRERETQAAIARGGRRPLQEVRVAMKEQRGYIYAIALRSLAYCSSVNEAEIFWSELHAMEQDNKLELTRPVFHAMLHVYATHDQQEKIRTVSVEMKRRGLPMDDDSVCTVMKSLCLGGHYDSAVMLHSRIPHGSIGLAKQSRKTYLSLLRLLAPTTCLSMKSLHDVYREGMIGGQLQSKTAHRLKWTIDLRTVPLELLSLSLHYHLSSMVDYYMTTVREMGQQKADALIPSRGLLIIVGKNRAEVDRERRHSSTGTDGDTLTNTNNDVDNGSRIIVDEFADEDELATLSKIDELRIEGSYVQRYVQHLLKHEWPSIDALIGIRHETDRDSVSVTIGHSNVSVLASAQSTAQRSSATLRVNRPNILFWLHCRAHILGQGSAVFPAPRFARAQSMHWAKIQEKTFESLANAVSEDKMTMSLSEQLMEYKRSERKQLRLSSAAIKGKIDFSRRDSAGNVEREDEDNGEAESLAQSFPSVTDTTTTSPVRSSRSRRPPASDSEEAPRRRHSRVTRPQSASFLTGETLEFLERHGHLNASTKEQLARMKQSAAEGDARVSRDKSRFHEHRPARQSRQPRRDRDHSE